MQQTWWTGTNITGLGRCCSRAGHAQFDHTKMSDLMARVERVLFRCWMDGCLGVCEREKLPSAPADYVDDDDGGGGGGSVIWAANPRDDLVYLQEGYLTLDDRKANIPWRLSWNKCLATNIFRRCSCDNNNNNNSVLTRSPRPPKRRSHKDRNSLNFGSNGEKFSKFIVAQTNSLDAVVSSCFLWFSSQQLPTWVWSGRQEDVRVERLVTKRGACLACTLAAWSVQTKTGWNEPIQQA